MVQPSLHQVYHLSITGDKRQVHLGQVVNLSDIRRQTTTHSNIYVQTVFGLWEEAGENTHTHTQTHKHTQRRVSQLDLSSLFAPDICYSIHILQVNCWWYSDVPACNWATSLLSQLIKWLWLSTDYSQSLVSSDLCNETRVCVCVCACVCLMLWHWWTLTQHDWYLHDNDVIHESFTTTVVDSVEQQRQHKLQWTPQSLQSQEWCGLFRQQRCR